METKVAEPMRKTTIFQESGTCIYRLLIAGLLLSLPLQAHQEAPNGPLPDTVEPTHYQLDLVINPDEQTFEGQVTINLEIKTPLRRLWMHGVDIDAKNVVLTSTKGKSVEGHFDQVLPTGVCLVSFDETVSAGPAILIIDYEAPLSNNLAGLFRNRAGF